MRSFFRCLYPALRRFLQDNCMDMAAAISYYVLLSLFPALMFILSILGSFMRGAELQARVIDGVIEWIPSVAGGDNILVKAIRQLPEVSGKTTSGLALAFLAWGASGMFGAVRGAVNITFHLEPRRPFLRRKVLDIAMVFAMGAFFVLSVASTALLQSVERFGRHVSTLAGLSLLNRLLGEGALVWILASHAIPFVLSFAAFISAYWMLPDSRPRIHQVWPGALLAAFLFELTKSGFVLYLAWSGGYNVVFGSLGAVVAFLLWVYMEAMILLYGAEVAAQCC